jgi:uncharacterized protein YebE (UPF0316 family)
MNPALIALMIFCLRICDVSIGTVRVIYTIRGNRTISAVLGFIESLIWIFAISRAFALVGQNPIGMIGWAAGFATGTVLGITLERWIATGHILMRVISLEKAEAAARRVAEPRHRRDRRPRRGPRRAPCSSSSPSPRASAATR